MEAPICIYYISAKDGRQARAWESSDAKVQREKRAPSWVGRHGFMMLETETETFLQSYTVSMRPNKDRLLRL